VKSSFEAAEMYYRAFGAEITFELKNDTETVYAHCEFIRKWRRVFSIERSCKPL
jgi:hypothetical protein